MTGTAACTHVRTPVAPESIVVAGRPGHRPASRPVRHPGLVRVVDPTWTVGTVSFPSLSKAWALRQVPSDSPAPTAIVQLRHVANHGASFRSKRAATLLLWSSSPRSRLRPSAGGRPSRTTPVNAPPSPWSSVEALGNLIDRLANGAVTDWAGIAWYPATFNLADVAIRGGQWSLSCCGERTAVADSEQ